MIMTEPKTMRAPFDCSPNVADDAAALSSKSRYAIIPSKNIVSKKRKGCINRVPIILSKSTVVIL